MSSTILKGPIRPSVLTMLKPELQTVVEKLCEDGCKAVNQYIDAIQAGDYPAALRKLDHQDCDAILAELKSIMAVYERRSH